MKYAFPEGRVGEIMVSLHENDKDEIELTVGDNGVGMPEELDFRNTDSLGLSLVNALVEQLQGEVELIREKGTRYKITFRKT
jgi:two-component sensor histidine kinase